MKKTLLFILVASIAVTAGAWPLAVSVGTTAVKILPERAAADARAWVATTAFSQGSYVKISTRVYMALVGGTSGSTAPSHASGTATDGTVTWYRVLAGPRMGFNITAETTNAVWISRGFASVTNSGTLLTTTGSAVWDDGSGFQGEVWAISATAGNRISCEEW